ncbi:DUF2254 domain-containing protein [Ancylobacter pratisalsi]|uniref:DUF2254 domain-containing protein n=1 Tax=Ancylobacter pratisalsi TaxID=1745854 RepID=A0A6P1YPE6_9HYPH|nr:DUF2254 domain-containing protein [Ancylobacter pratisalsi]QIB35249.1 DUF2254 domain-containing protein [Ancylobacter pratisalsi]
MSRWQWIFRQLARRLWLRATLIGALGVGAAVLATLAERFFPEPLAFDMGADAVDSILSIIASSMLAVTTFSISVMTSAFGAATSNVTPRATKLLMQDRTTQNVLSTFIGSFIFSIVGIIVLKAGAYGPQGRVVLFIVTIAVIMLVVGTLMGWIDHLTRLGRVGETTERVEAVTLSAINSRLTHPCLGGVPLRSKIALPETSPAVRAEATGYVEHIDVAEIADCAEMLDSDIFLAVVPGAFVYPDTPLAHVVDRKASEGDEDDEDAFEAALDRVRRAVSIGHERSFDQDPRFGLAVLSEIAMRALSPAVNDPGTAIDVIGRCARLLILWAEGETKAEEIEVRYPRVHVPALDTADLFDDAFRLVARDGARQIEVQMRLQKALRALSQVGDTAFREAARHQSRLALERAETEMTMDADKEMLRAMVNSPP